MKLNPTLRRAAALTTLLLAPAAAMAWGTDGHKIVADIAEHELTPAANAAVKQLLGDETMADVSVWADQVRRRPEYRWSAPLHYVNVQPGETRFDAERDCPKEGCVVSAIVHYSQVLRSKTATSDERTEALKFLIHFVGDAHQPLHASFERDRGGNDIKVQFFGHATNLHAVWDTGMIEAQAIPWQNYAEKLRASITPEERGAWSDLDPADWATESYQLAVSNAYPIPEDHLLGQEYTQRNIGIVETRLTQAGVRLGLLLNDIFEPEPAPAAAPAPSAGADQNQAPDSAQPDAKPESKTESDESKPDAGR